MKPFGVGYVNFGDIDAASTWMMMLLDCFVHCKFKPWVSPCSAVNPFLFVGILFLPNWLYIESCCKSVWIFLLIEVR